ncbi:chemotaxis protein CheB [Azospirillum rugosum]|uniref:protein-glutamate O-methyltransferase n=1 Tax=Azospirillum rugosum TaxID=416170 RepID=A0ABS4SHF2_9PROT|nr:chemotaxis protein CheB [Azospirillum rugosum]MBP2291996.1 two-component system CheB/CheR fusion protein [Azospirillum rugosum]MDQ0525868.1 two-component system CheB/CheR fusion protein [Azospirillum rugosum]
MASEATAPDDKLRDAPEGGGTAGGDAAVGESPLSGEPREERACCIVGIGASAGGLEALQRFFDNVPGDSDLAYVVVQHLSPVHKSLMVDLLGKHTSMTVVQAADSMVVERNTVYLLPPAKHLSIEDGRLRLTAKDAGSGMSLPIDIFFTALAQDQGPLAMGVILSGTGSDGTRGLLAIKAAGGYAAVQDPETAQFDGMPRSAIATGQVDATLPPAKLPAALMDHARRTLSRARPAHAGRARDKNSDPLAQIVATIRSVTGVDFSHYKLATLLRRIERRMHGAGLESMDEYAALLRRNNAETVHLYKEMLIGVTRFFRDESAFAALNDKVVPALLANRSHTDMVRVWVCGCATGEEAYSIAILFAEAQERLGRSFDVKIFATDIDQDSIEIASLGEFPRSIAEDVSQERLTRFFSQRGDKYVVARDIRRMVVFAVHNIMRDPPFTKIDLVSCRNLLIYMDAPLQRKVLSLFQYALRQSGFLFLGTSETLGELSAEFHALDSRNKVFQSLRAGPHRLSRLLVPTVAAPLARRGEESSHVQEEGAAIDEAIGTLMKAYVPPCLLINDQMNIMHVFGDASAILKVPAGEATLNALKLLPSSVSMVVGTALSRAFRSGEEFALSNIPVKDRDGLPAISLRVKPFVLRKTGRRFALVLLDPAGPMLPIPDSDFDFDADAAERIRGLEQELMSRGENLQATIEELETANEELQATNEELLASNEELQSTNEELQSVNEELYSVNAEYQAKVEELTEVTNDLDNLLRSTEIGTIFLDVGMVIRRFTPAAARFINIIPRDVGRSITHLSTNIDYPNFLKDIGTVFETHTPIERHVQVRNERWIQTRILPYLTDKQQVAGVVVTFVDVTAAKEAEHRLQTVLNSLPEHVAVIDSDGIITMVNAAWRSFGEANGAPALERCGPGTNYLQVCTAQEGEDGEDIARAVNEGLRKILNGEISHFTIEYPCHSDTEERWFMMHACRLNEMTGGAVVSHINITNRKQMELRLSGRPNGAKRDHGTPGEAKQGKGSASKGAA